MSNENRETKEINVGGHVIVYKTYLTGREEREIQNQMLNQLELNQKSGEPEITGFKGAMLREQQDKYILNVVVSIDGSSENILDRLLDLPSTQFNKVMEVVQEIAEKKETAAS